MIKTESIPMHMHQQPQSSILPDIYGSSSPTLHHYSAHPHNFAHNRNNNNNNQIHNNAMLSSMNSRMLSSMNSRKTRNIVHHVNPGSYVSSEDRAFFEQIQGEELAEKDLKIAACQNEINQLQNQISETSQHARNMENINNDLETRLEQMAKDRIQLNNQLVNEKKKLNLDIENWKQKYDTESLRNKNLVKSLRQLEKELYMMHLRKYDYLAQLQNLNNNNNNNAPRSSVQSNNEEAIAFLNRQGGLPSPINVDFLLGGDSNNEKNCKNGNDGKASSLLEQNDEKYRILEENAARQIILKRTKSTVEDDGYDPVTDLACELSRQRGRGKMVKQLSLFFGF